MRWGEAWVLNGLWALAALGLLLWLLGVRREQKLRLLLADEAVARLAPGRRPGRERVRSLLWLLACALVIAALARPQWGSRWQPARQRGLDILVVLDTSNSMRAADLKPSRLLRAKLGLGGLLGKLGGDRIGLVAFAGSSFLQCPLTDDYAAFSMILDDVSTGTIPRGGTAIAPALVRALESFEKGDGADRAVILVSDGEDHEGGIERAVAALKDRNVRVFAVGVGTLAGAGIPVPGGQGDGLLRDAAGNLVVTTLRERVLERIAAATGGMYVRAESDDLGLERVYSQGIAALRRDERDSKLVRAYEERFSWFLGAALLLLCGEALLGELRRERGGLGRTTRALALLLAVLVAPAPAAAGEARRALREAEVLFSARSFAGAAAKFAEAAACAAREGLDPAVAHNDRAVALLMGGQAPEAAAAFEEAARTPDPGLREQAHFNRGVALAGAAGDLESRGDFTEAIRIVDQALEAFESAMLLDPGDEDPKVNHEALTRTRSRLEEKRRAQDSRNQGTGVPPRPGAERPEKRGGGPVPPRPEMTPDEAREMLEAMKRQETSQRRQTQPFPGEKMRVAKDW